MNEKNIQLYPSKVRIVPNCKLAKVTANRSEKQYDKLLAGKRQGVIEKKNHKKHGEIISDYFIVNAKGYDGTEPLNFFDYSVLSVCISEMENGNMCTTPAVILRGLTGKTTGASGGTHNGAINPDQRNAIMASVTKLMGTVIKIDNSEVNKKLGYNDGKPEIITDTILPCRFITSLINGQPAEDTIFFDRQSPIFTTADQRNQIIRYDTELLDVPNQNNTPLVITIKNYVILRIFEIKLHKMTPTITLADIFKKARIEKSYEKTRQAKETISKFLEHLQEKAVIKSFNWNKSGTKIISVSFTF